MGFTVCAYELADPTCICRKGIRLVLGIFPHWSCELPFGMGLNLEEPQVQGIKDSGGLLVVCNNRDATEQHVIETGINQGGV